VALARLSARIPCAPRVAVVLGSGLAAFADALEGPVSVPFLELPPLPPAGVEGHAGCFVVGQLRGIGVLVQAGRVHAYEGVEVATLAAPVRMMARLGVEIVVMTNAAGAIHPLLQPGDLVLLEDQIDLSFRSPLRGPAAAGEVRFPDMSQPFDPALRAWMRSCARRRGLRLPGGTYAGVLGPSFETPAEIRMLQRLGADLVGMSTVHEVAVARALGLRVVALSMVTNRAAGMSGDPLSHGEVLAVGGRTAEPLVELLTEFVHGLVTATASLEQAVPPVGGGVQSDSCAGAK
jgi:purine-nucleoside phosphorylase